MLLILLLYYSFSKSSLSKSLVGLARVFAWQQTAVVESKPTDWLIDASRVLSIVVLGPSMLAAIGDCGVATLSACEQAMGSRMNIEQKLTAFTGIGHAAYATVTFCSSSFFFIFNCFVLFLNYVFC